jgi:hypothetical protein
MQFALIPNFFMGFALLFSWMQKIPVLLDEEENMQKSKHFHHKINYLKFIKISNAFFKRITAFKTIFLSLKCTLIQGGEM